MLKQLLTQIIKDQNLHIRWLNTLSYLENCGARKIALSEDKLGVNEQILKHAAEEFRHAYYLKKQMAKIGPMLENYHLENLLGSKWTIYYLDQLEVKILKFLKTNQLFPSKKMSCYLLMTYAIEKRAEQLYPLYDECLKSHLNKISVRSIILEEKEHLAETSLQIDEFDPQFFFRKMAIFFENEIYDQWLLQIINEAHL